VQVVTNGAIDLSESALAANLTDDQWSHFQREGYVELGRVLDEAKVEVLKARADQLALGTTRNAKVLLQLDTGGAYEDLPEAVAAFSEETLMYRKIQGLEHDDEFRGLVEHPMLLDACHRQYGEHAPLSLFRAMVMNKPAGQGTVLPWHQDGGRVWKLDRDPLLTFWVALDPASKANGCVEVVPRSHLKGLLTVDGSNLSQRDVEEYCQPEAIRALEVPAGHGVLLHNWLLHRSGVNTSDVPRRAFTSCYMDGRTVSTLTGERFPPVFEDDQPPASEYDFLANFYDEREHLRETAEVATHYARSLESARAELETQLESARQAVAVPVAKSERRPKQASISLKVELAVSGLPRARGFGKKARLAVRRSVKAMKPRDAGRK